MSNMAPEEPPPGGGGGNILTRKFGGIPGWVILAGVAVLAFMYFRSKSGTSGTPNSASSGQGQQSTGDISVGATTPNITINEPYGSIQTATGTASTAGTTDSTVPTTANPQPTPRPKPSSKKNITQAATGSVTVAPYSATNTPWNSTLQGISRQTGVPVKTLLQLNPQLTQAGGFTPGETVKT